MTEKIKDHKELRIWQQSIRLAVDVYEYCKAFPLSEKYGLVSQIQRSAVSIPSNIAEGYSRGTRKDYIHFLHIARGSAAELETQIILSQQLYGYQSDNLLTELSSARKMLAALIKSLSV